MSKTESDVILPDDLSSSEMAALADFDADISERDSSLLEARLSTPERLQQHRFCALALSSSSDMLKEFRRQSPEDFDAMLDCVDAFQEEMKTLSELAQKAFSRLLIVGSLTEDELQS